MLPIIRQLEEKYVANEIDILLWSDRMDLVAYSNNKGEVALHRLTWTRAWILPPNKEGNVVKAMAWRPDGKVLAIGYNNGQIVFINVENKTTLHNLEVKSEVSCLAWVTEKTKDASKTKLQLDEEEVKDYTKYVDYSAVFLPPVPSTSFATASTPVEHSGGYIFQKQTELNFLAVGTCAGLVHFFMFGSFSCMTVNVLINVEEKCRVTKIHLSENLGKIYATAVDPYGKTRMVVVDSGFFHTHKQEMFCLGLKYQQIKALMNYLTATINSIKETWENILLEMDAKLSKYASKVPAGTLSADFLDLLLFGVCTDDMQEFLLQDLTKKGLEKFGQSIETSYTNIQKLLLNNISKAGQNITYHLSELRGMARLEHRYQDLGLVAGKVTLALGANGSFLVKAGEMQQIINNSMINYKAFFRWLYTAIIHLMYENIPTEIPKMTQTDLAYITEFLQNFDHITGENNTCVTTGVLSKKSGFIMERLGQYLEDKPLTILANTEYNEWDNFVDSNECFVKHPMIFNRCKEMSLLQQYKALGDALDTVFNGTQHLLSEEKVENTRNFRCCNPNVKETFINIDESTVLYAFLTENSADGFYLLEITEDCVKGGFIHLSERYAFTDISFYSESVISVLLIEKNPAKNALLFQCGTTVLRSSLQQINEDVGVTEQLLVKLDASEAAQSAFKPVPMVASKFSVSGKRRVSVVLSENRKKVILFEMEGEEEEEEDVDMTNSTAKSDASMQEGSE